MRKMRKVKNLTMQVVLLRLKSGRTLIVEAGTASEEIDDVELKNNANIERLLERGIITLQGAQKEKPAVVKKQLKVTVRTQTEDNDGILFLSRRLYGGGVQWGPPIAAASTSTAAFFGRAENNPDTADETL